MMLITAASLPTLTIDPVAVGEAATEMSQAIREVEQTGTDIVTSWAGLGAAYYAPEAPELRVSGREPRRAGRHPRKHAEMKRRLLGTAAAGMALAFVLTACSNGGTEVNTNLTVEDAKQIAMQTERAIVAVIPPEYVASTEQAQEGVLLSCDDGRGYRWTGRTRIQLQGAPDVASLIESVTADFSQRPGYAATQTQTAEGRPRSEIVGEYRARYLLSAQAETDRLEIASFSPCFKLPEDQWAGGTY